MSKEYMRIRYNGEYMDITEGEWGLLWDTLQAGDRIEVEGIPDYE